MLLDNHKQTALHVAAWHGHLDLLEPLLIERPQMLLAKDSFGRTALHHAYMRGHLRTAQHLLNLAKRERVSMAAIADHDGHVANELLPKRVARDSHNLPHIDLSSCSDVSISRGGSSSSLKSPIVASAAIISTIALLIATTVYFARKKSAKKY